MVIKYLYRFVGILNKQCIRGPIYRVLQTLRCFDILNTKMWTYLLMTLNCFRFIRLFVPTFPCRICCLWIVYQNPTRRTKSHHSRQLWNWTFQNRRVSCLAINKFFDVRIKQWCIFVHFFYIYRVSRNWLTFSLCQT